MVFSLHHASSRLVIAGASGNSGRKVLDVLSEYRYPVNLVMALGYTKAGTDISYGVGHTLRVAPVMQFEFKAGDIVIVLLPGGVSCKVIERAITAGCVIIDGSGAYASIPAAVPVIVPEVNPEDATVSLMASPSPISVQLAIILNQLGKIAPIKSVSASTYQAVSSQGKRGMDELYSQARGSFSAPAMSYKEEKQPTRVFGKKIAFNCVPQVGEVPDNDAEYDHSNPDSGYSEEEKLIIAEVGKLCGIPLSITCVYVPVFVGNGVALHVEFDRSIKAYAAEEALRESGVLGVVAADGEARCLTQIECMHEDLVLVSRIRQSGDKGLALWSVMDNMYKGVALNMVQILALLLHDKVKNADCHTHHGCC